MSRARPRSRIRSRAVSGRAVGAGCRGLRVAGVVIVLVCVVAAPATSTGDAASGCVTAAGCRVDVVAAAATTSAPTPTRPPAPRSSLRPVPLPVPVPGGDQPESAPSVPADPAGSACGFTALDACVGAAITTFFQGLVADALNPLLGLLSDTLLTTPDPDRCPGCPVCGMGRGRSCSPPTDSGAAGGNCVDGARNPAIPHHGQGNPPATLGGVSCGCGQFRDRRASGRGGECAHPRAAR